VALVICKECGAEISSNALTCPKCGFSKISKGIKTASKIYLLFWGSIIGFFALLAVIGSIISSNETPNKREKYFSESNKCRDSQDTSKDTYFDQTYRECMEGKGLDPYQAP